MNVFDFLNDVCYGKKNILNKDNEKEYSIYLLNRFLSGNIDTLLYAQELNTFGDISKYEHYSYLLNAIPKKKRFNKFIKEIKDKNILLIQEYYNCSYIKAKRIIKMLSTENIQEIECYLDKGGK